MNRWKITIYEDGEKTFLSGIANVEFLEHARELITETIEKYQKEEKNHDKRTIH